MGARKWLEADYRKERATTGEGIRGFGHGIR